MHLSHYIFLTALPPATLSLSNPLSTTRTTSLESTTDTLLFSDSMAEFQSARAAQDPPELDWTSDDCSDSPDDPFGFNFVPSCQRHDFGYRNYKAQGRFTDANKAKIDENFKEDMDAQCEKEVLGDACRAVAEVYYQAVKVFGGKKKRQG